jgi:capsule assembly protein Wzi
MKGYSAGAAKRERYNRCFRWYSKRCAVIPRAATLLLAFTMPTVAAAQSAATPSRLRSEVFAGSVAENYLRYLQSLGLVPVYPWTSRSFSPRELERLIPKDSAHPWSARFRASGMRAGPVEYDFVRPTSTIRFNSAFPYGSNDGPVWAGRGLTSSAQAGIALRWKWISLTAAPMAFRSENSSFEMLPTTNTGVLAFADPLYGGVDHPQRFGASAYTQIDPGQSTLRVDLPFVTAGVSTANMGWGPGTDYPLILGNNAAGFPHAFFGTSEPLNIFVGKLYGRVMWGELLQSKFSPVQGPEHYISRQEPGTTRFATGVVVTFMPRGMTGLEFGASRFFHSIWPVSGIPRSYLTKVFQGILKKDVPFDFPDDPRFPSVLQTQGAADNQLISGFARWVLPRSGFEVYGEYAREDHAYDFRDLLQEPDHSRFYMFGARKVFTHTPSSMTAGRAEVVNFQLPQLSRYRGEGEIYFHGVIRQGHTNRGQLLGANVGVGSAAGSTVAVDHYSKSGSWTASWVRDLNRENGNYLLLGIRNPRSIDVMHALGFEMTRFFNAFDASGGLTFVRNFNRNFTSDVNNLNATLSVSYKL